MNLPRIHPRTLIAERATNDLRGEVLKIVERHELTPIEIIRALLTLAQTWSKYALRMERHGTTEKKADEE